MNDYAKRDNGWSSFISYICEDISVELPERVLLWNVSCGNFLG